MPEIKGTDIVLLRKLNKEKDDQLEQTLFAKLSEQARDVYLHAMPISWTPIDIQAQIYEAVAEVMYPGDKNRIFKLHLDLAKRTYTGLYKVFLAIPSVQFVIKRAASIWRTYYNAGETSVENISDKALDFIVTGFPELPFAMRESTNAHIVYLAQATGKKGVAIKRDDSNREKWVWHVSWES